MVNNVTMGRFILNDRFIESRVGEHTSSVARQISKAAEQAQKNAGQPAPEAAIEQAQKGAALAKKNQPSGVSSQNTQVSDPLGKALQAVNQELRAGLVKQAKAIIKQKTSKNAPAAKVTTITQGLSLVSEALQQALSTEMRANEAKAAAQAVGESASQVAQEAKVKIETQVKDMMSPSNPKGVVSAIKDYAERFFDNPDEITEPKIKNLTESVEKLKAAAVELAKVYKQLQETTNSTGAAAVSTTQQSSSQSNSADNTWGALAQHFGVQLVNNAPNANASNANASNANASNAGGTANRASAANSTVDEIWKPLQAGFGFPLKARQNTRQKPTDIQSKTTGSQKMTGAQSNNKQAATTKTRAVQSFQDRFRAVQDYAKEYSDTTHAKGSFIGALPTFCESDDKKQIIYLVKKDSTLAEYRQIPAADIKGLPKASETASFETTLFKKIHDWGKAQKPAYGGGFPTFQNKMAPGGKTAGGKTAGGKTAHSYGAIMLKPEAIQRLQEITTLLDESNSNIYHPITNNTELFQLVYLSLQKQFGYVGFPNFKFRRSGAGSSYHYYAIPFARDFDDPAVGPKPAIKHTVALDDLKRVPVLPLT